MRSCRTHAVLLVVAGGLLAVLAGGRTWLTVTPLASAGIASRAAVEVTGREAAPGGPALGLVALAGAVALLASGRRVRQVVAGLLVLCGAGLVAVRLAFGAAVDAVAQDAVARATGTTVRGAGELVARPTAWGGVCAAAGVLVAAGAVLALVRGGRWSGPARRYETAPVAAAAAAAAGPTTPGGMAAQRDRAYDAWDALSSGADPTDDAEA